jgi:hypothetical protein
MVVVVTGMHRSGTSSIARAVSRLGVDLGAELLAADPSNPRGYFEDRVFVELHRRMLTAAVDTGVDGWHECGWTDPDTFDPSALGSFRAEAERLAEQRSSAGRPWGFKDPRGSLTLGLWAEVLPDARYVVVYREPWAVADSLLRKGEGPFLAHPDWAVKVWIAYNARLLDFARTHREQCLLVSLDAIRSDPEPVIAQLAAAVGGSAVERVPDAVAAIEPGLLGDENVLLQRVVREAVPECVALLAELDAQSGSGVRGRVPPPALGLARDDAAELLACWGSGPAAVQQLARAHVEQARLLAELERVAEESRARQALYLDKERESLARRDYIEELEARLKARDQG